MDGRAPTSFLTFIDALRRRDVAAEVRVRSWPRSLRRRHRMRMLAIGTSLTEFDLVDKWLGEGETVVVYEYDLSTCTIW